MPCSLLVGNRVLGKQQRRTKLSSPFSPYPYLITAQKGLIFTAKNLETHYEITQNQTHFKLIAKQAIAPFIILGCEEEGERIARFDGYLKPDLKPVFPPNNNSISINNTIQPKEFYLRRFRRPVHEWHKY